MLLRTNRLMRPCSHKIYTVANMSLIPYAAGELGMQGLDPMAPLYPMLYKDTKWAARKIGRGLSRAYRARKRSVKKRKLSTYPEVGEPVKLSHVKRHQTFQQDPTNQDTRVLYSNELTDVQANVNSEDRYRTLINCKGIELCYHCANINQPPLYLNCAVIAPKHGSSGISVTDFFRANDGQRGQDFDVALGALEFHYLPINTDKYIVMRHYRHVLGGQIDLSPSYNADTGPSNYITRKIWLPINRQLRYDNAASNSCNTPIYFVWWFDRANAASGAASTAANAQMSFMHTMFFKEVL